MQNKKPCKGTSQYKKEKIMKTSKLPTLYQYTVCPFCCKIRALLNYKNIKCNFVEVNPLNKKEIRFSKDYKKVPIFVDEKGNQVNDSTPIMRYIEEKYLSFENKVFETEEEAKLVEDRWLSWGDSVFVKSLPPLIYKDLSTAIHSFDYITKEGQFSWFQQRLIKYTGAVIMKMVAGKSAKKQGITDPEGHFDGLLKTLEAGIGEQDFLGNDKVNGADLAIFGVLNSVEGLPVFLLVKKNKKVFNWFTAVKSGKSANLCAR